MKKYLGLALVALLVGVMAVAGARVWRPTAAPVAPAAQVKTTSLALELTATGLEPPLVSVPKDHRVRVSLHNATHKSLGVSLQGYQDRISIGIIAPDSTWRGEFDADRPGEDFAWMVEGEPRGRLVVRGSHLVEGHR